MTPTPTPTPSWTVVIETYSGDRYIYEHTGTGVSALRHLCSLISGKLRHTREAQLAARMYIVAPDGDELSANELKCRLGVPSGGLTPAERGRLGGIKGGPKRAAILSPARRAEIATRAALARWNRGAPQ